MHIFLIIVSEKFVNKMQLARLKRLYPTWNSNRDCFLPSSSWDCARRVSYGILTIVGIIWVLSFKYTKILFARKIQWYNKSKNFFWILKKWRFIEKVTWCKFYVIVMVSKSTDDQSHLRSTIPAPTAAPDLDHALDHVPIGQAFEFD